MLAPWLASQSPLLRRKRTSLAARSTSETCVVSPVNASRRPSRDAAHHSGSGRMASPYPMGDFHLLFFANFPGALRALPKWVVRATSAYPPIATTERTQRDVSNVASAEIAALFDAIVWQLTPIAAPARRSHHTSLRIGGAS